MRIGGRLLVGFGILSAVLALVAGVSVVEATRLDAKVERMVAFRMPVSEASSSIGKELYASLASLRGFLLTGKDSFKADRAQSWTEIAALTKAMDGLASRFTNPRNVELWNGVKRNLSELKTAQDKAEQAGVGEAGILILTNEALPRVQQLANTLYGEVGGDGRRNGGLIDNQRQMLKLDAAAAESDTATLKIMAIGGLIGGLMIAGIVITTTRRTIVPPIASITNTMGRLAAGDLSISIPGRERTDEIGEMAAALEAFRDGLVRQRELEAKQKAEEEAQRLRALRIAELTATFDQSAAQSVQAVASSAQQLQGTAQDLSASAGQTSQQATAVAAASEEASVNVQTVASAAEELSGSITEISRQVTHSSHISSTAVAEAVRAEQVVADLSETVKKIGDVVNLINDIASQTNLLALNATIEAARAGEAGKGFAVVANEVKNLANQTGKATDEIAQQITAVQEQTERVVNTIQGIVKVIEEVGQISTSISSAVEEQSAATQEIARNVEQAAVGTAEVTSNVVGVQEAADQTGRSSGNLLDASRNLANEADGLKRMIERFLSDVRSA
ncbi:chemotaxis protein [Paramagnetospirillum marisnigri]|uniref:Chemotaxis protein n=1 Tax=Paramagnetospirillum marisnigri TaxID=1285242 RepID=A0A178MJB5_9PROT|nr:methyl-accepting chemotaxis protein [Paramagnetospirillum marisnigri]OAN48766.1 chemotaxis protein [Paramagnetospirillum marisnigri]